MREELKSIAIINNCWRVPESVPPNAKKLQTRWVFKKKTRTDGSTKFKARLVIKGFLQTFGLDYTETFAPKAKMTTVRVFLTLCRVKARVDAEGCTFASSLTLAAGREPAEIRGGSRRGDPLRVRQRRTLINVGEL